jgi:hypothetical protein
MTVDELLGHKKADEWSIGPFDTSISRLYLYPARIGSVRIQCEACLSLTFKPYFRGCLELVAVEEGNWLLRSSDGAVSILSRVRPFLEDVS